MAPARLTPVPLVRRLFGVKTTYTVRELQRDTAGVVRSAESGALVTVTRHERPVVHLISDERIGALLETLELAGNPEFVQAVAKLKAGGARGQASAGCIRWPCW